MSASRLGYYPTLTLQRGAHVRGCPQAAEHVRVQAAALPVPVIRHPLLRPQSPIRVALASRTAARHPCAQPGRTPAVCRSDSDMKQAGAQSRQRCAWTAGRARTRAQGTAAAAPRAAWGAALRPHDLSAMSCCPRLQTRASSPTPVVGHSTWARAGGAPAHRARRSRRGARARPPRPAWRSSPRPTPGPG
jgi:hypothetical protein